MLPLVIRVEDTTAKTSSQFVFASSPVHVGRNPLNELALTNRYVSQWHAIIRFDETATHFVDLGSTNGTELNGKLLAKGEAAAVDGSVDLRIGDLRLHFSRRQAEASRVEKREWTQFGMRAIKFDGPAPAAGTGTPAADPAVGSRTLLDPPTAAAPAQPVGEPANFNEIFLLYAAYRSKYAALHEAVKSSLTATRQADRAETVKLYLRRFPALAQERNLLELLTSLGVELPAGVAAPAPVTMATATAPLARNPQSAVGSPSVIVGADTSPSQPPLHMGGDEDLLNQFVRTYLADGRRLENGDDLQQFLGRLAEVLETYSNAFLELRRGHEQFGREISVRTSPSGDGSPLGRARSAGDVLKYLLDWSGKGNRTQELMAAFVDVMIHQVALLNGMRAGVRRLLQRLSPQEIDSKLPVLKVQVGPLKLPGTFWPVRAFARWREFVELHKNFADDEQQLTSTVLGPEFAKAYATIMSESSGQALPPGGESGS